MLTVESPKWGTLPVGLDCIVDTGIIPVRGTSDRANCRTKNKQQTADDDGRSLANYVERVLEEHAQTAPKKGRGGRCFPHLYGLR